MLRIEQLEDVLGRPLAGFFVRNGLGKAVAIGANSVNGSFVTPTTKRYCRDVDMCRKIGELTGIPVKWNLSFYGRHVSSGTNQELMAQVNTCRDARCNHHKGTR